VLEYKRYKEAAVQMAEMEAMRMLMVRRGNLSKELSQIGEESGEGTEIQTITLFKLMKTFERVMKRLEQRNNKPVHTVVRYNYTMEESREYMLSSVRKSKTVPFEKIFNKANDRIQAIFLFLSMLELVQLKYLTIMVGEGRNNFIVEYNENREEDEFGLDGLPNGLMAAGNENAQQFGEEFEEEFENDLEEEEEEEFKGADVENKMEIEEEEVDEEDDEIEDEDEDEDEGEESEENDEDDNADKK
ncbi:MAG: hypothetical protein J7578_24605, partial [Chitinophagaceae bacterium]|nr:hypothetical protein [Chitinophagaceae bacterium]